MVSPHCHLSELFVAAVARHPSHQSGFAHGGHFGASRPGHIGVGAGLADAQLPYSHHQRKKRLFRFLSNAGFDSVAVQTALLAPICQAARLRGLTPIMIDWSDLGQGRNGLFAAVCFRGRGLPLLSWVSTPAELDPSQNRVEEFFIGRLLRHLPTTIRPLLLADRGFGRASPTPPGAADAQPYRLSCGLRNPPQG